MKSDEQPIYIVGLLFGICVTFWADNLADYANRLSDLSQASSVHIIVDGKSDLSVSLIEKTFKDGFFRKKQTTEYVSETIIILDFDPGEQINKKRRTMLKDIKRLILQLPKYEKIPADDLKELSKQIETDLAQKVKIGKPWPEAWFVSLVSGALFLIDILCILWWFSKYIYRIQPHGRLSEHFMDFSIVGMFVLASGNWDKAIIFLMATAIGSAILITRFYMIYRDPDATDTDKHILRRALAGLGVAGIVVIMGFLGSLGFLPKLGTPEFGRPFNTWVLPALPGALSLIGIALTWWLRDKIAIAGDIREGMIGRRFNPMRLHWPALVEDDGDAKGRIRGRTADGLESFHKLFRRKSGKLSMERVRSRVHAEGIVMHVLVVQHVAPGESDRRRAICAQNPGTLRAHTVTSRA